MAESALTILAAKAAADPAIRSQAHKDLLKFARQFTSLLIVAEDLERFGDLDAALRSAQSKVDELNAEAASIIAGAQAKAQAETDAMRQEAQAAVDKLRAEGADLGARVSAARGREKALATSIAEREQSISRLQAELGRLTEREAALRPIVAEAEQTEARLATAQRALAEIEARRTELLKSLGVA